MSNVNKIIVPVGYMGSGSSAITDIMSEVKDVDVSRGSFEFVFLHCPNGVFDLEDKLLKGNNALRSDEALHSFLHTMRQLYDKKYWWVGHYNKNIGEGFYRESVRYVEELTEFKTDFYWYYQENVNWNMVPKLVMNKILKLMTFGKYVPQKVVSYPEMWLSYVSSEEFYSISKKYIYNVLEMAGAKATNIVFDQLLLPQNLHRLDKYFDDDVEVFVVERDPRDVFISNKYYWPKMDESVPYPTNPREFCEYYRKVRKLQTIPQNVHVHTIKFEDMIYNYDETVKRIFNVLGWNENIHIRRGEKFNPSRSINNTQLFLKNETYKKECEVIIDNLKEYIYDFPYEINHNRDAF